MILIESVVERAIIPDETYRSHITCNECQNVLVTPRVLKPCSHLLCLSCIPSMQQKAGDPEVPNMCPVIGCKVTFIKSDIQKEML